MAVLVFTLLALIHSQTAVPSQRPENKCAQIEYSAPGPGSKSFQLSRVEGQAVFAWTSQKWELGSANGVCVNLFHGENRELVASATTDGKGQFEFSNIAPGEYVLIAFAAGMQKVGVPVQLTSSGKGRPGRLLIHLREEKDSRKGFVTPVTNVALRKELLSMVEVDQDIRNEQIKCGVNNPCKEILARMDEIGLRNTARMKRIIKEFGWPGPQLVGWDGTEAAFVLVQHADHSVQKELLPMMRAEFKSGTLSGPNYALFTDRVLVEEGKPQIYGSRAKPFDQWKNGEPVLYPIEDEASVDQRRAAVGLSSLAEYRELLKQMYLPKSN